VALPEDSFYEIAMKEVTTNRLAASIWGRAFSENDGDSAKAKAQYIKLRVDQLTRLFTASSPEDYLRELWPDIKAGENFVCPTCKRVSKINAVETDFFIRIFSGAPRKRYYCANCNDELATERGSGQAASPGRVSAADSFGGKSNSASALIGFILGLVSVVLYFVGVIPILAIVFSGIGLATFDEGRQKNRWMAFVGLALGVVYTVVMLNHYGHLN
jgi:hypothetical protein